MASMECPATRSCTASTVRLPSGDVCSARRRATAAVSSAVASVVSSGSALLAVPSASELVRMCSGWRGGCPLRCACFPLPLAADPAAASLPGREVRLPIVLGRAEADAAGAASPAEEDAADAAAAAAAAAIACACAPLLPTLAGCDAADAAACASAAEEALSPIPAAYGGAAGSERSGLSPAAAPELATAPAPAPAPAPPPAAAAEGRIDRASSAARPDPAKACCRRANRPALDRRLRGAPAPASLPEPTACDSGRPLLLLLLLIPMPLPMPLSVLIACGA